MAAPEIKETIYTGLVLDFETGGLNTKDNCATQLCAKMIRFDTFEVIGIFNEYFYPFHKAKVKTVKKAIKKKTEIVEDEEESNELFEYTEGALTKTGITMEMLYSKGIDIKTLGKEFVQFLEETKICNAKDCKPFLIGQNITFDVQFFLQFMEYAGIEKEVRKFLAGDEMFYNGTTMWVPKYHDTLPYNRAVFCTNPNVRGYTLGNLCEAYGVENDDAHNALYDVNVTKDIFEIGVKRARNDGGEIEVEKQIKTRTHFKI